MDVFSPAYPGYVTTRRFADLTSPYLAGQRSVLDVGCGTAELTCELARRHPEVRFQGVDHSREAIARGHEHVARLGLENVELKVADAQASPIGHDVDLVVLFDSFHHLPDPAAFVAEAAHHTERFLLVEPAGDWKGAWQHGLDMDWLLFDIEKLRLRVASSLGEQRLAAAPEEEPPSVGEPIEHRYSMEEFESFFAGFGLEVRGTVAGFESYPPGFVDGAESRGGFGELGYELVKSIDDQLRAKDLDLWAKHWVISADRKRPPNGRRPRAPLPAADRPQELRGPCDARYSDYTGPSRMSVGATALTSVTLTNLGWATWSSDEASSPRTFLSYHWLDRSGQVLERDGRRSPLPRSLEPGASVDVALEVAAPAAAGRYQLSLDCVQEGVCWFSDMGTPTLLVRVDVG